ncbi:MAG: hypothetical protein ACM3OC_04910 [Deltaproteobacteria bacterium]
MEQHEYASRFKADVSHFTEEVEKIFVDSSVEVIDKVKGLADSLFDDTKSLIDKAANGTKAAGDRVSDYVRRNPWKAAAALMLVGLLAGTMANRTGGRR